MDLCSVVLWRAAIGKFKACCTRMSIIRRCPPMSHVIQAALLQLICAFFVLIFIFAIPLCMLLLAPSQLFLVSLRKPLKSFIDVCLHAKVVPCLPVSLLLKAKYFLFFSGNRNTCCSFFSAFFSILMYSSLTNLQIWYFYNWSSLS